MQIIPIGKNNSIDVKNFRPIALIPVIIKIINSYIKILLEKFCTDNKIIPVNRFAYQKNKNTLTATEELINIIIINKNNKKSTLVLYLDFSKAYSTYIKFISSITLCMENKDGNIFRRLQEGILQGSVISPILFNIYSKAIHSLVRGKNEPN